MGSPLLLRRRRLLGLVLRLPLRSKISDLKNVGQMKFEFESASPSDPSTSSWASFPPSATSTSPRFRDLMTDPNSPIIDFYPSNFEADLNGKKQDWEAVVKIPFIDEKRLLEALDKREVYLGNRGAQAQRLRSQPRVHLQRGR